MISSCKVVSCDRIAIFVILFFSEDWGRKAQRVGIDLSFGQDATECV